MKVTPKDIAQEFGIDAKRVRRVMRSLTDERAGHGGTWDMNSNSEFVAELRARLTAGGRSVKVTPVLKSATRSVANSVAIAESISDHLIDPATGDCAADCEIGLCNSSEWEEFADKLSDDNS